MVLNMPIYTELRMAGICCTSIGFSRHWHLLYIYLIIDILIQVVLEVEDAKYTGYDTAYDQEADGQ